MKTFLYLRSSVLCLAMLLLPARAGGQESASETVWRDVAELTVKGKGWTEPEVTELLAELSPAVFVLDPLPNLSTDDVLERMENMVRVLREAQPGTPIILVENLVYPTYKYIERRRKCGAFREFSTASNRLAYFWKRRRITSRAPMASPRMSA